MTLSPKQVDRWNRLPVYSRAIAEFPSIRRVWLPFGPAMAGSYFVYIAAVLGQPLLLIPALGGVGLTGLYAKFFLKRLEQQDLNGDGNKEPVFGQIDFLGDRLPVTFDMGLFWSMPGLTVHVRSQEQFNDDVTIEKTQFRLEPMGGAPDHTFYGGVAHGFNTHSSADIKAGGSCEVKLGLTFERDWTNGHDVLDYDDVGETIGALDIIRDAIEADLREIGRRLDWIQASFGTDLLSAHILAKLTGIVSYKGRGLFDNPDPDFIADFLRHMALNGAPYIHGLGLIIRRAEVKSVDPVGKLAGAAEAAAVQLLYREGLLKDADALADAAKKLGTKLDDGSLTQKDLINIILVNDKNARAEKRILEFSAKDVDNIAELLKGLLERKGA